LRKRIENTKENSDIWTITPRKLNIHLTRVPEKWSKKEITKEIIEENYPKFHKIIPSVLKNPINVQQNKHKKAQTETHR
jgi:hypothetical protein